MATLFEVILIVVMSFNIRYDNPGDGINQWDNRKEIAVSLIREVSPDFLGLQEVRASQLKYLGEQLVEYNYFGKSRSEDPMDEHSPIFFKKNKYELLLSNTFWLSETPDKPSKGWDAALNRIVTWGKLKHKETGKIFFHFNTHFDHIGEQARLESAKLLKKKIREIAGDNEFIVTGDFNFDPSSNYYQILTEDETSEVRLVDASLVSDETERKGTFTGFDLSKPAEGPIDYIFVKPTLTVSNYEVIDTTYNGRLPSDHFPVKAVIYLRTEK